MAMASFETVGFHAQQAAEKALKALLASHQVEFGRTHEPQDLLDLAEPMVPGIRDRLGEAQWLAPFAVRGRYPGGPLVDREQADRALTLGHMIVEAVEVLVRPYLEA
jgi:HEPN domain-containing protein